MIGTNVLREKNNMLETKLEGQQFEKSLETFIESLYEPNLKENSYHIKDKRNMDENLKKFMNTCRKVIRTYANNIKRDYTIDPKKHLLDEECEDANIYLYIVESLYYFYMSHCNSDLKLFEEYINDLDKTYINSENKEYTFIKFIYMSVERMVKEENKVHESSLEKGNMNDYGRFSRIELDATSMNQEGEEIDRDLFSIGGYKELGDEDTRTYEETLADNIKEMIRVQDKLSTILTNSQVEFITQETYGCYYDIQKDEFIRNEYTKQQRNQYFNQISKRTGRDIKSFFVKKHTGKYVDNMISYRKKNKKVLEVEPRNQKEEYINQHSNFFVSNVKING